MDVPSIVELTRCDSGAKEQAQIETLTRESAKSQIDAVWWRGLGTTLRDPDDEPDRQWQWRVILSKFQSKPAYRAKCVRSSGGDIEAAMLFRVDVSSALSKGQRALFVDRLATAPRNRDGLVESPGFRGAGTGLLIFAIAQSYSLGFGGRVNLYPIANVLFYEGRGFQATNVTKGEEMLYELPAEAAMQVLVARGLIDG